LILFFFGRTIPKKKPVTPGTAQNMQSQGLPTDTLLAQARKLLTPAEAERLNALEHSVVRGDVKAQQLKVYHQLATFWLDTAKVFEPYAWYTAESARLENSEKTLTFAAHLLLENLRGEANPALKNWKALQAKDLFERSLKINPDNDSSQVGLGACYIFGNISEMPMEGIMKVRAVVARDSTNLFAQEVLGDGSMISGQFEKAIERFETIYRLAKDNSQMKLQAAMMLADAYEKKADKVKAIEWYNKSLFWLKNDDIRTEVKKRIEELKK
jgi:tetratricopeptide (TPR) repeat protein